MRDANARPWHRWRITHARTQAPISPLFNRRRMPTPMHTDAARRNRDEQPGPDGIRHELVARIRREIATGTYDTDEKWLAVEAELLRRIEERM